jgi:hypothetical protein
MPMKIRTAMVRGAVTALLALLALGAAGAAQAESAGTLLSTAGDVRAQGPAGERAVQAHDALAVGERLVSGPGATAALASGDFWVQVGPGSVLAVRPDGRVELERGTIRVIDLGEGEGGAAVLTPHAEVRAGGDTEIEAGSAQTRLRQGDGTARVVRRDATGLPVEVTTGREAVVDAEGIVLGDGAGPQLALSAAEVDVAVSTHFQPADVAAPPSTFSIFPFDPDKRTFHACDSPGSGCAGSPQVLVRPSGPVKTAPPGFDFGTGPADPPGFDFGTGPADGPGGNGPS